jgi:hypothetical protein
VENLLEWIITFDRRPWWAECRFLFLSFVGPQKHLGIARDRRRRIPISSYASAVLILPKPRDGVVVEDVDDDLCLYRTDIDEVLVLNQSAGDVWRLVDGRTDVDAIAQQLSEFYQVDLGQIRSDVRAVVDDLAQRGFLVEGRAAVDGDA